ncbi:unnamed protein product [Ilex paraguariensis]|uniref:Uncharacterized protein n=1 Tax=Ilex paraguariensis TaxID=185542 RepID=A0ABC8TG99_9AQUA
MVDSITGSYANTLVKVANSNGTLKATSADIEKVEKFFSDPEVFYFFSNPTVNIAKKVRYGNGASKLIDMSVKKQLEEIAAQLVMFNSLFRTCSRRGSNHDLVRFE